MTAVKWLGVGIALFLSGCAHIDFGQDNGLTYYDPKPYFFVSTNKNCMTTATVVVVPETKRTMKFVPGFGSADLSAVLSNGMITSVGQKTDTKLPETITALTALGTAFGIKTAEEAKPAQCKPTATLYPVLNGVPDSKQPIPFSVEP
jgi:hypothetical protein